MAKTLFDHINHIYGAQTLDYFDSLDDGDKRTFVPYMINRIISMKAEYVPIVNEFQKYLGLVGPRESYLFYSQLLPARNPYAKYVKGKKDGKYEDWVIELLAKYFSVSLREATDYCEILYATDEGKADLRRILEMHGIDPKQIKKAKV